jgi:hypothetical protein
MVASSLTRLFKCQVVDARDANLHSLLACDLGLSFTQELGMGECVLSVNTESKCDVWKERWDQNLRAVLLRLSPLKLID